MDILKVEKLTHEKWVNLFAAEFRHHGKTGRWTYASRKSDPQHEGDRVDAVVIVPVLHAPGEPPRLVMLREFRAPVGGHIHALPAGLLEEGESVEDCTRRELREETGFEVTRVKKISSQVYCSAGLTDESIVMVFVDARTEPGAAPSPDASEDFEVVLLDYEGVCCLCDSRERIDAKAWMALYLYQCLGKIE